MSLLPQSKKSPEEIAKLRETLGVVGPPPAEGALSAVAPISTEEKAGDSALPPQPAAEVPAPVTQAPKIVRSLRKSEQGPVSPLPPPPVDTKLPVHRHTDREIQEIRRREMLAARNQAGKLIPKPAHPGLIIPGYLLVIAAALGIHFHDLQKEIAAGCVVGAMIVAAFIFFKRPLSVHHAAFITVAVLFVVVFGALHYFPQLRHGT